jgi:ABC-2 type transport system ATP-binding protein
VSELLAIVQLEEKRRARVGTLSGGQKQRLSVACSLAGDPELLFLDEPTTGLDPQSRRQLWELVERFRASGRTILLTTHYMDEAERLCDRVAIVDHGRVIALGTPRELISGLGADHVVEFATGDGMEDGVGVIDPSALPMDDLERLPGVRSARRLESSVSLQVSELHEAVPALLAALDARGLPLVQLRTHSSTLEDVFVSLTGRQLRDG